MSKQVEIRYQVNVAGRCIESLCRSLREARALKRRAIQQGATNVEIIRYDRNGTYKERVE